MTLQEIAKSVGGTVAGNWINIAGPGHSSADRSLGFRFDTDAPDGFRIFSLAGDDAVLCRQHVKGLLQAAAGGKTVVIPPTVGHSAAKRIDAAKKLWSEAVRPEGTLVQTYLTGRRCISDAHGGWKDALRFHPHCPFGSCRFPAMLALIQDVSSGVQQGVHRTALSDDGSGKRVMPDGMNTKMMMGKSSHGAIMLSPFAPTWASRKVSRRR